FDAASTWATALEDPQLKATALSQVVERYAEENPAQAAQWITRHANEPYATRAVADVSREWVEQDPAAAIEWASNLTGEVQSTAVTAAFNEWADDSPFEASEYLGS